MLDMVTTWPMGISWLGTALCGWCQLVPLIHQVVWSSVSEHTILQMLVGLTPTEQVCLAPAQDGIYAQSGLPTTGLLPGGQL